MRRATIGKLSPLGDDLFDPEFLKGTYRIRRDQGGDTAVVFTLGLDPYRAGDRSSFNAECAAYLVETLEVARYA